MGSRRTVPLFARWAVIRLLGRARAATPEDYYACTTCLASLLCMHVASLPASAAARRHDALTSPLSAHEPPRTLTGLFLHASRHGRRDGRCCWFVSCHTLVSPIHSHLFNVAIKVASRHDFCMLAATISLLCMHDMNRLPSCQHASMRPATDAAFL